QSSAAGFCGAENGATFQCPTVALSDCARSRPLHMTSYNYLIAGRFGPLGANLVSTILETEPQSEVTVLDCPLALQDAIPVVDTVCTSRLHRVNGDIANEKLLVKLFEERNIDVAFLATMRSRISSDVDTVQEARCNFIGTTHFLEALRSFPKLRCFVYVSSENVYGSSPQKVETASLKPVNSEAASQGSCEAMLNAYFISYGIPVVIARLSSLICGPTADSTNPIGSNIVTTDASPKSVIDVRDAVSGLLACAKKGKPGEIYNIGGDREVTTEQIRELIAKLKSDGAASECDLPLASMDSTRAHKELAWHPRVPLLKALKDSLHYYAIQSNGEVYHRGELKVLIYGGRGWIGGQLVALLKEREIKYVLGKRRPGTDSDEAVLNEIIDVAPSHVVSTVGRTHGPGVNSIAYLEGSPERLYENVRDNLYAPCVLASICDRLRIHFTYVGTSSIFRSDNAHLSGGKGYSENDYGNYSGTSYTAVKGRTDWLMRYYTTTLNVRMGLPVNYELDWRNLVARVIGSSRVPDVPISVTVLPDCLPVMLDLMINCHRGTINLVNPGPIRCSQIIELYRKVVSNHLCETSNSENGVLCSYTQCVLDTSELQRLYPSLRTAIEGIKQSVVEVAAAQEAARK
uniref:NAD-dependent epimerase/dehydratase domain-containing protein n=1 Tax=Parascaris univalens TaxID=6257 RepID=A0A915B153_PARUN